MEYLFDHFLELQKTFDRPIIAFFDFDMTLAPVAENPKEAFLLPSTRKLLVSLSEKIPVGIISGRSLDDIVTRVNIPNIMYAGNHGAQWMIEGREYNIPLNESMLQMAREKLTELSSQFPEDTFLEDKRYTIAFHYRMARKEMIPIIEKALEGLSWEGIYIRWSKMTFEVRSASDWNKWSVCLAMMEHIKSSAVPIYVWDDLTDEDAFKALAHGITIRVGQSDTSHAQYYLRDQEEIDTFLDYLLVYLFPRANGLALLSSVSNHVKGL